MSAYPAAFGGSPGAYPQLGAAAGYPAIPVGAGQPPPQPWPLFLQPGPTFPAYPSTPFDMAALSMPAQRPGTCQCPLGSSGSSWNPCCTGAAAGEAYQVQMGPVCPTGYPQMAPLSPTAPCTPPYSPPSTPGAVASYPAVQQAASYCPASDTPLPQPSMHAAGSYGAPPQPGYLAPASSAPAALMPHAAGSWGALPAGDSQLRSAQHAAGPLPPPGYPGPCGGLSQAGAQAAGAGCQAQEAEAPDFQYPGRPLEAEGKFKLAEVKRKDVLKGAVAMGGKVVKFALG